MKEVTFKNVKCKTGGLIPRKGDARYERYLNIEVTIEDSMSLDSMNWKGLREYRRNDSRITLEVLQGERNGDYVTSLEGFDTTFMDSVWLDIKISWNVNDDSRLERNWNDHLTRIEFLTTVDHMSLSRCRLMRSLREDNVDLPYGRMKL
ncbi:hypothetical protein AgCh_031711 [Apium graveolens]